MIKEAYITTEIALLLKAKGAELSHHHYMPHHNPDGTSELVSVYTQQGALAWFREEKGIDIEIRLYRTDEIFWGVHFVSMYDAHYICNITTRFKTYEDAVNGALKYAFEHHIV